MLSAQHLCAWCDQEIQNPVDPLGGGPVNYGICPSCLQAQKKALVELQRLRGTTAKKAKVAGTAPH